MGVDSFKSHGLTGCQFAVVAFEPRPPSDELFWPGHTEIEDFAGEVDSRILLNLVSRVGIGGFGALL